MDDYMGVSGDYYERAHTTAHKSQVFFYNSREDYLIEFMGLKGNEKIIDIGCGSGTFSRALAKKYPQAEITGADISAKAINFAGKKTPGEKIRNLDFVCAPINNIPLKSGSFDVAIVSHLIEHVHDTDKSLLEVSRILKKGGTLILTTPNYFSLWPVAEKAFDMMLAEKNYSLDDQHVSRFNAFSIKKLVEETGFALESQKTLYIFSLQASLLSRRLGEMLFRMDKLLDFLPVGMVIYLRAKKK